MSVTGPGTGTDGWGARLRRLRDKRSGCFKETRAASIQHATSTLILYASYHMAFFRTLGLSVFAAGALAACDATADDPQTGDDETLAVEAPSGLLLQADGRIGDRYVPVPDGMAAFRPVAGASAKAASVQFSALYNIVPPSAVAHATHLTFQDGGVAASYLVPGNVFGGGFDIIDRADPAASTAVLV